MDDIFYEYFHDKDTNMTISRGESNRVGKHFHRSIEILYLLSGEMRTVVGDNEFVATPDDIIFVHNYYVHSFFPKKDYKKYFIVVPADYSSDVDKILRSSTLPAHMTDKKFNKTLRTLFEKMYKLQNEMSSLVKRGYLNIIIGNLLQHYHSTPIKTQSNIEFIVDVLHYIDLHYDEELSLDSLATTFGYNKYYFSRLFNRYIGESLTNYINIVRIQNFIRLTKETERYSVSKLAFDCGFDSLTTFYRYFNKMYGDTPKNKLSSK